jgi:hypothetical protein
MAERTGALMSAYRFLSDHYIGTQYFYAGTIASTADVGGTLPVNWLPSNAVDPLDTAALNAFCAIGPKPLGLVRQQWVGLFVAPPVTYWRIVPGSSPTTFWQLTGLGASKAPIGI